MEKVKVTQEQEKAIKRYKEEQRKLHSEQKGLKSIASPGWGRTLLELDTDDFIHETAGNQYKDIEIFYDEIEHKA